MILDFVALSVSLTWKASLLQDGEIDFDEFKTVMMTPVDEGASDQERVLRRKMRTTVRTLIMRQRFTSAIVK